MIKGIVKLSEQAQDFAAVQLATVNAGGLSEFHQLYRDKFAELIVRECVTVVADAVDHREPASTYASKIQQHFGIE